MSDPYIPLSVVEAKRRLDDGWKPYVLDVRSTAEAAASGLEFSPMPAVDEEARRAAYAPEEFDEEIYGEDPPEGWYYQCEDDAGGYPHPLQPKAAWTEGPQTLAAEWADRQASPLATLFTLHYHCVRRWQL